MEIITKLDAAARAFLKSKACELEPVSEFFCLECTEMVQGIGKSVDGSRFSYSIIRDEYCDLLVVWEKDSNPAPRKAVIPRHEYCPEMEIKAPKRLGSNTPTPKQEGGWANAR